MCAGSIGLDFKLKDVTYQDKRVKLQIWLVLYMYAIISLCITIYIYYGP